MTASDLTQALSQAAISTDGFTVENKRHASDVPALEPGAPHTGADPLDDQVAFKLGYCSDDDDGAAQRAARVDLFAEADELYVEPVQFIEHFQEVLQNIDQYRTTTDISYNTNSKPALR